MDLLCTRTRARYLVARARGLFTLKEGRQRVRENARHSLYHIPLSPGSDDPLAKLLSLTRLLSLSRPLLILDLPYSN